jgi:hypothetical protein
MSERLSVLTIGQRERIIDIALNLAESICGNHTQESRLLLAQTVKTLIDIVR